MGNSLALGADTSTYGIYALIGGKYSDLGTGAGLSGNTLDLYDTVKDLRHLQFKESFDQPGVGTGNQGLGTTLGLSDFTDIDLNVIALFEYLTGDLLVFNEHSLALTDSQQSITIGLNTGNHGGQDLKLLGIELLIQQTSLRITDPLDNDLLGSLCRNTAKLLGLDLPVDHIAHLGTLGVLGMGFAEIDLGVGIFHRLAVIDYGLLQAELDILLLTVDQNHGVVRRTIGFLGGTHQSGLYLFQHVFLGNAPFCFDHFNGGKKFSVHFLSIPPFQYF